MHRNTYLLIIFLAIFAALVVGVNLGKRFVETPASTAALTPTATPSATAQDTTLVSSTKSFESRECGIRFDYPGDLTIMRGATGSAFLINPTNQSDSIAVACQDEIPRPPLPNDKIDTLMIFGMSDTASVAAKLYHDGSPKDGTPINSLIFHHPKIDTDVFIAGFGKSFDAIISTIKLLP